MLDGVWRMRLVWIELGTSVREVNEGVFGEKCLEYLRSAGVSTLHARARPQHILRTQLRARSAEGRAPRPQERTVQRTQLSRRHGPLTDQATTDESTETCTLYGFYSHGIRY